MTSPFCCCFRSLTDNGEYKVKNKEEENAKTNEPLLEPCKNVENQKENLNENDESAINVPEKENTECGIPSDNIKREEIEQMSPTNENTADKDVITEPRIPEKDTEEEKVGEPFPLEEESPKKHKGKLRSLKLKKKKKKESGVIPNVEKTIVLGKDAELFMKD